jgi:hypothetical protein
VPPEQKFHQSWQSDRCSARDRLLNRRTRLQHWQPHLLSARCALGCRPVSTPVVSSLRGYRSRRHANAVGSSTAAVSAMTRPRMHLRQCLATQNERSIQYVCSTYQAVAMDRMASRPTSISALVASILATSLAECARIMQAELVGKC